LGIWFGAVYASHHYVVDILAGWLCCASGISLTEHLWRVYARRHDSFLAAYLRRISSDGTGLAGSLSSVGGANGVSKHSYSPVPTSDMAEP